MCEPWLNVPKPHRALLTACHTLGLDGKSLIANTELPNMDPAVTGGVKFNDSRRFDMTASNPSNAVVSTYTSTSGDVENARGDRYTVPSN